MAWQIIKQIDMSRSVVTSATKADWRKIGWSAGALTLLKGAAGYDTGENNYVILPTMAPGALVSWDMLQVVGKTPKDANLEQVTSIRARLWNGTAHRWWNGSTWVEVLPDSGSWNTVQEVSDHLSGWDPDVALGVVLNLRTTDDQMAPTVTAVKLLCTLSIVSFVEDWIYGTLIARLQNEIRPVSDVIAEADGSTQVSFSLSNDYEAWQSRVTTLVGVYDKNGDPNCRVNLASTPDSSISGPIGLISAPVAGTLLLVRFRYAPVVALQSSTDYEEDATLPALTVEDVDSVDHGVGSGDDHIMDIYSDPPAGVIIPAPRDLTLDITMEARAPLGIDLARLTAEVRRWLDTNKVLTSPATGEKATLVAVNTASRKSRPNLSNIHAAPIQFRVMNIKEWNRPARPASGVSSWEPRLE